MKNTAEKISELLKQNATIWANLGTGSKFDLGSMEAAEAAWEDLLEQIKILDTATWGLLKKEDSIDEEWEEPSFIDENKLAELESKVESMDKHCSLDDDECLSCGA